MFPNLDAEQARKQHTNEDVAKILGLSRKTYENKKKYGNFKVTEINTLMVTYNSTYEYLFSSDKIA